MDIKIDEIVKQVLSEIDAPSRPVQPKTTFVLEETPALTGREVGKTAVLDSGRLYDQKLCSSGSRTKRNSCMCGGMHDFSF